MRQKGLFFNALGLDHRALVVQKAASWRQYGAQGVELVGGSVAVGQEAWALDRCTWLDSELE